MIRSRQMISDRHRDVLIVAECLALRAVCVFISAAAERRLNVILLQSLTNTLCVSVGCASLGNTVRFPSHGRVLGV